MAGGPPTAPDDEAWLRIDIEPLISVARSLLADDVHTVVYESDDDDKDDGDSDFSADSSSSSAGDKHPDPDEERRDDGDRKHNKRRKQDRNDRRGNQPQTEPQREQADPLALLINRTLARFKTNRRRTPKR